MLQVQYTAAMPEHDNKLDTGADEQKQSVSINWPFHWVWILLCSNWYQMHTTQTLDTGKAAIEATTPELKPASMYLPMLMDSQHVSKRAQNNWQGTHSLTSDTMEKAYRTYSFIKLAKSMLWQMFSWMGVGWVRNEHNTILATSLQDDLRYRKWITILKNLHNDKDKLWKLDKNFALLGYTLVLKSKLYICFTQWLLIMS